ncbi:hypothetical protein [Tsukamurella sp. PLM1]|uniref:hypothetical protein n=1 Tax=Tsukamurella sp. PLM1 TaxID=2929795 RepID=UPI0020BDB98F|nr:hypothetical protein [Tsukamurella sp. PLM1]
MTDTVVNRNSPAGWCTGSPSIVMTRRSCFEPSGSFSSYVVRVSAVSPGPTATYGTVTNIPSTASTRRGTRAASTVVILRSVTPTE